VRLTFEGNLVGDLLFEVQGQAGALPLLQFTLDQLFQRRSGRQLTLSAYRELGGVKGALTRQAEETYAALPSEEHRKLARALFVRLIDPGASEQDTTRRRAALSEFSLPESSQTRLLQEVADAFIVARLLTTNEIAGTTTIEVSHEALIREWKRLAEWLREARDDIGLQQTISKVATEWEQHNKPGDRLYRGSQLKEARAWARRNTPSGNEVAFLHASVARDMRLVGTVIAIVLLVASTTGLALRLFLLLPPDPTVVTTLKDSGLGSLRWDIENASQGSTITFDKSLWGYTILLTGDLPITNKSLNIRGPGAGLLTVSTSTHQIIVFSGASTSIVGLTFIGQEVLNSHTMLRNEGTLTLTNSTISGNSADEGGGIYNESEGTLTLTNSTVSGNTVSNDDGGGIALVGSETDISFCTIYGNKSTGKAGGILNEDYRASSGTIYYVPVSIRNSLVALNHASSLIGPDILGNFASEYNLIQDTSGATFNADIFNPNFSHATDVSVDPHTDLRIDPLLRDNGGPTKTLALLQGSPAIDKTPLAACQINGIFTDQRGIERPDGNESACDIGAYEYVDSHT
jgi:parallel beta-helix repeat protein